LSQNNYFAKIKIRLLHNIFGIFRIFTVPKIWLFYTKKLQNFYNYESTDYFQTNSEFRQSNYSEFCKTTKVGIGCLSQGLSELLFQMNKFSSQRIEGYVFAHSATVWNVFNKFSFDYFLLIFLFYLNQGCQTKAGSEPRF